MAKKPKKSRFGPTPKLERKVTRDRLLRNLRTTGSRGRACSLTGLAYNTLLAYLRLNPTFAEELIAVEEQALDDLEEAVHRGAKKDPTLALRVLERKRHSTWGKKQQIMHGGKVRYDVSISVDEQRARLAALDERFGLGGPLDAVPALPRPDGSLDRDSPDAGEDGGPGEAEGSDDPESAGPVGSGGKPKRPSGSSGADAL